MRCGERTARYVHQVISSALERAARKHLIPFNVARYADPPPMPESEEQLALTLGELSCFFEVARRTRFENYFVVSALCGARPQEILGLKWSDNKPQRGSYTSTRARRGLLKLYVSYNDWREHLA